jgi:CubicO group peptidase (beta-lactamase class C family)
LTTKWLGAALDYLPRWIEFQMRVHEQPGCAIAVAHRGEIVLDETFGYANLARRERLTPRHRFRVASHSKSFAAAGVLRLAEQRRLRLDDRVGRYVSGLHPAIARATLVQLLSHGAGVVRDGTDSSQFQNHRPFLSARELREALRAAPTLRPGARFKYSNHGFGLVGLAVEAVTGEPYRRWIEREVMRPSGLRDTLADMPSAQTIPLARGHSGLLPLGRRVVLPGDFSTQAIAPAAGVVSTAADLARFYGQLSPRAQRGLLSPASRRRMVAPQWEDTHSAMGRQYGLGIMAGRLGGWECFGHSGGLLGYITRTAVAPKHGLAVSVLTNAADGLAHWWIDGAMHILRTLAENGAPSPRLRAWRGRWWSAWGAVDLVPAGNKVLVAAPGFFNPFNEATQIRVLGRGKGVVSFGPGYASHGEPASLVRGKAFRLGGARLLPERQVARDMARRYRTTAR